MNQPLSADRIAASSLRHVAIEVVTETGSTNADLLARIDKLQTPVLLVAETQTAGRGRAGRTWHSAPGVSLTFSLAWHFSRPLHAMLGLPLAVGVALAETLARFHIAVQLKWPNDVLKDGNKLAGILIETAEGSGPGNTWAVIGIGLNMGLPQTLTARVDRPIAGLESAPDRNELMAALLNGLTDALTQFGTDGFEPFRARWNALDAYRQQAVVILDNGRSLNHGIAQGVDAVGRLLLETATGEIAITAGDVSLRIAES